MDVLEWGVGWGDGGMEIGIEDCEKTNRSQPPWLIPSRITCSGVTAWASALMRSRM